MKHEKKKFFCLLLVRESRVGLAAELRILSRTDVYRTTILDISDINFIKSFLKDIC